MGIEYPEGKVDTVESVQDGLTGQFRRMAPAFPQLSLSPGKGMPADLKDQVSGTQGFFRMVDDVDLV